MNEENLEETAFDNHGFKEEIEYAGFWIRFGAALIDGVIFLPLFAFSYYNQIELKSIALLYILAVLSALYKPLMEWKYGATLGKMACKIKVVNENLKAISIDQGFGRYVPWAISLIIQLLAGTYLFNTAAFKTAKTYMELQIASEVNPYNTISLIYLIIFLFILIWAAFDKKSQGLHDKIAKTFVIKITK